jgi:protein-S-isoprenylcysteine O-methyltransferase Ste14
MTRWSFFSGQHVYVAAGMFKEEQRCMEKFGEEYRHYMEKVPRVNFLLGIIRALRRKER